MTESKRDFRPICVNLAKRLSNVFPKLVHNKPFAEAFTTNYCRLFKRGMMRLRDRLFSLKVSSDATVFVFALQLHVRKQGSWSTSGTRFLFPERGGESVRKCAGGEACSQVCRPLECRSLIVVGTSHLPASASYKRRRRDSSASDDQFHCSKLCQTHRRISVLQDGPSTGVQQQGEDPSFWGHAWSFCPHPPRIF